MPKQSIYLDNATRARPSEQVLAKMVYAQSEHWESAIAPYRTAQQTLRAAKEGYRALYQLLGAKEEATILFTSSGAEAVNQVISSTYLDLSLPTGRNHFITSVTAEASMLLAMTRLERMQGVLKKAFVNEKGQLTADAIADELTPRTALVSLPWADGVTGVIHPVAEIADLCRERGVYLHIDGSHALGKIPFRLEDIAPDFLSFDGGPLHGPLGSGALYIREGLSPSPLICGGNHQGALRGADLNVPALLGLGLAAKETLSSQSLLCMETARLRDQLEQGLQSALQGVHVLFKEVQRLPHISLLAFEGVTSELLSFALNEAKLFANMGGGNFQKSAHLARAAKVPDALAMSSISLALSRTTTEEEIEEALSRIVECVQSLRKTSHKVMV